MPRPALRHSSTIPIAARDVSPLGASRFEGPFTRSPSTTKSHSKPSSASTTPSLPAGSIHGTPSVHSPRLRSDSLITPHTSLAPSSASCHSTSSLCPDHACNSRPQFTWFASADEWEADGAVGGVSSDACPDRATLAAVQEFPVYDSAGATRPFAALYDPSRGAPHARTLLVFVRHFFCGACQAYLRALARAVPASDYFAIPKPTAIVVVGCGQPHLIRHYRGFSECPFPVFVDPERRIFKRLGMVVSANPGRKRPEYMKDVSIRQWLRGQLTTVKASLRDPEGIEVRDVLKGGHPMQIGGEFLVENGHVVWCHRMKNYRGHAEVEDVRKVLGLDE